MSKGIRLLSGTVQVTNEYCLPTGPQYRKAEKVVPQAWDQATIIYYRHYLSMAPELNMAAGTNVVLRMHTAQSLTLQGLTSMVSFIYTDFK